MKMKLLKLSMTLVIGALVSGTAFAQGQEVKTDAPVYKHAGEIASPASHNGLNKVDYSNWKYPIEAASTIGGTFNRFVSFYMKIQLYSGFQIQQEEELHISIHGMQ